MGNTDCNLLSHTLDHNAEHLEFITETYQYIQLIDHPTRITAGTRTLIDHIFTNKPDIITNHGVLHEQMNNHFCSLGSKLASGIPDTASQPEDFLGRTDLNFCFRPVNVGYILNLISNLKPSVSCGLDNISSRLLKLCSPYISDSICDIINHVLETGIFPDDWKKAKVHPIFKSDERNIPSNYIPISILPAISKIIQRVMHIQLLGYFQAGNLYKRFS